MHRRSATRLVMAAVLAAALATPAFGSGIAFLQAGCEFDYWPQAGWKVAPGTRARVGRRLLRASHHPQEGLALEAWIEPPVSSDAEEDAFASLAERGWRVDRVDLARVGSLPAKRARAHRRTGGRLFLMHEYLVDAPGRRYVLRVTGRSLRALQKPELRRWLASFKLSD